MKKTVSIAETVEALTPQEFKTLDGDATYKLVKTERNDRPTMVYEGDSIRGSLKIIDRGGAPSVMVNDDRSFNRYIATSGIVEVVDVTDTTLTFRTEGGVYKLERLPDEEETEETEET